MSNFITLPALGASLLVAVAGGIQLGESTIGLINPVYFQGPAIHPRDRGAAIDESQLRPAAEPGFASLYGWDEGRSARLEDCGDCEAIAARDAFAYEPEVRVHRATIDEWDQPAAEESYQGRGGPDEIQIRDLESELKDRVVRYAYYEIEAEEEPEEIYYSDGE